MVQNFISDASREAIRTYFESTESSVFKTRELQKLLGKMKGEWAILASTSFEQVMECAGLVKVRLTFPSRPEVRYCKDGVSIYELMLSVKPESYLTHYTALYLHDLVEHAPKNVFVNAEQSPKPQWESHLQQENIDRAFQRQPRTTSNIAEYGERRVFLLSGKNTGRLGVISKTLPTGEVVHVTGMERTLIDAVVRPIYCGGVRVVQEAFQRAKGKVSVGKLADMLEELDYLYPYHQSIGFFLDRANIFDRAEVEAFFGRQKEFNFYLDHNIQEPEYSPQWRVYYPRQLDSPSN